MQIFCLNSVDINSEEWIYSLSKHKKQKLSLICRDENRKMIDKVTDNKGTWMIRGSQNFVDSLEFRTR